jgi:hypothetical protein
MKAIFIFSVFSLLSISAFADDMVFFRFAAKFGCELAVSEERAPSKITVFTDPKDNSEEQKAALILSYPGYPAQLLSAVYGRTKDAKGNTEVSVIHVTKEGMPGAGLMIPNYPADEHGRKAKFKGISFASGGGKVPYHCHLLSK